MNESDGAIDGRVLRLIQQLFPETRNCDRASPLFSSGLLDSFAALEIIAGLEKSFSLSFDIEGLKIDQLDTVDKITALVTELRNG